MNRNTFFGTLGVSLLLLLVGIVSQQEASSIKPVQSNLPKQDIVTKRVATETQMSQLANASNNFGFDLLAQLQKQQPAENILISPQSIAIALAMARKGTKGETLAEMDTVLGLADLDSSTIDRSYLKLLETLKTADPQVKLAIANSLWVDRRLSLQQEFVSQVQEFYQGEISNVDFGNFQTKNKINQWVSNNTENKIPQIIDSVSPEDALYIINAIYFKGIWKNKFDPNQTTEQPFYGVSGTPQPHPMMNQTGDYRYFESDRLQAVRLPYGKQGELGMYIFLPTETSSLEEFNQQLTSNHWQEWLSQMRSRKGNITIPRFKLEYDTELQAILSALGMKQIFNSSQADFSALTDTPIAVNKVKHKTFIEVNEEGTEAAAVTSIGIRITSAQPQKIPFNMNVNRPFFFAIRDDITQAILFMGNVTSLQ